MSVLDTLRAATPLRKTVDLILDGALQAEWHGLLDELDEAGRKDSKSGSLALPETSAVIDRMDAIRDRVKASEVTFTFERIEWGRRLALQAEHPPRDGNLVDSAQSRNVETYFPALVRASCVSVTDAAGDTAAVPDEMWDALFGTLNFKQMNTLFNAATHVNEGESQVPPSARSLLESQDFGASLAQPSPGTSPQDDSGDGNPPGSRKSSGTKKGKSSAT